MVKKISLSLILGCALALPLCAQNLEADALWLKRMHDIALTQSDCYPWLSDLSLGIGGRLSGSPQAAAAVEWGRQMLDTLGGVDSVWLQPCTVPHWVRGQHDEVRITASAIGSLPLHTLALGGSGPTAPEGIIAPVVEVHSLSELANLGSSGVKGKIVFFNRPMDATQINTFSAYGGAVDQRGVGPSRAAALGAVGAIVRSMTTRLDDVPHTGSTIFEQGVAPIPAFGISTNDAELLSGLLEKGSVSLLLRSQSQTLLPKQSHNVIGEIRGSEFPDEIILVGGHLDSWDVGQGAHDDGSGCVQAMAVLQLLHQMQYRPKRTIRAVLFMNEENGLAGGKAYQVASDAANEFHLAAIESDRGGFTPRGFTCDGHESVFTSYLQQMQAWLPLLEPYGLTIQKGGSGADISGLKPQKGILIGLYPDSQRYFDYHHTAIDNIDAVNKRELELGAAAMTALVYLLDQYGLGESKD